MNSHTGNKIKVTFEDRGKKGKILTLFKNFQLDLRIKLMGEKHTNFLIQIVLNTVDFTKK